MKNNLKTTPEQQEGIEDFFNVLKLLQNLRKTKDEYERRIFNFDITEFTKFSEKSETKETKEEIRINNQQIEKIWGQVDSGYYFGTNTYERKFYTGYYYDWYNIPEYYPYTFTVNSTYACGDGDPINANGKYSFRHTVTSCRVEGLKSPIQDFIKGYLKETYDWYYDQLTIYVNRTYDPDAWESYFEYEAWRSQAIQLRLKFYEEFVTNGCRDPGNPNPSWTWGNFVSDTGVYFDMRATCPQTWSMKETYNEGWIYGKQFVIPEAPIGIMFLQDFNIIDFGKDPHLSSQGTMINYKGNGSGIVFLMDADAKYDLGLIHLGGEKFCFMPSVDANGDWMPDTISFDYVVDFDGGTGYIGKRNTTPYMTTSERFYLAWLYPYFTDFFRSGYVRTVPTCNKDFIQQFYTISAHNTYGTYWRKHTLTQPEPWDLFLEEHPDFPAIEEYNSIMADRILNEYLKDNFSIDYIAEVAESWTRDGAGAAGDQPDPIEIAKIKQMMIKANPYYLEFFGSN